VNYADSPVSVDAGQLRPQADSILIAVSISAQTDRNTLKSVEKKLASDLVDLSMEPNIETAKENIRIVQEK
jgi:hypothetical protein